MLESDLWVIGCEHIIKAMREEINNWNFANQEDIKVINYSFHKIVIVWSLNKEKVMYMSKVLNSKIHETKIIIIIIVKFKI